MTGGVWVSTDTEEIDRLASGFTLAIAEVGRVNSVLVNAQLRLAQHLGGGPLLEEALELIDAAKGRCASLIEKLGTRAQSLREAAAGYEGTSTISYNLHEMMGRVLGRNVIPVVGGQVLTNLVTGERLFGPDQSALLLGATNLTGIASITQIVTTRMRPDDPVGAAEGFITMGDPVDSAGPAAAGSLTDVAKRIELSYYASDDESQGAVEIQRVEHADGTLSWVVAIPGTQTVADPDQPMNAVTNVPAYLGISSPAESMVVLAMARAGIKPGEEVLLAGHSQGGMTAVRLANDPAVTQLFTIAGVMTFGAPVGHIPVPNVPTLNVRHVQDGVPAIDGSAIPEVTDPQQVTVVRTLEDGVPEHDMATYIETMEVVEEGAFPGLTDWQRDTAHLFAGEGDEVTAQVYLGTQG